MTQCVTRSLNCYRLVIICLYLLSTRHEIITHPRAPSLHTTGINSILFFYVTLCCPSLSPYIWVDILCSRKKHIWKCNFTVMATDACKEFLSYCKTFFNKLNTGSKVAESFLLAVSVRNHKKLPVCLKNLQHSCKLLTVFRKIPPVNWQFAGFPMHRKGSKKS